MSITFIGTPSVIGRTIFVDRGAITKPPMPVVYGSDLEITGTNTVKVASGGLLSTYVGFTVTISGAANAANNGTYTIAEVRNGSILRLSDAAFHITDVATTTSRVVALTNDLRRQYESHRVATGIHYHDDTVNIVSAIPCSNLASAIPLLNELKSDLVDHAKYVTWSNPSPPQGGVVHKFVDPNSSIYIPDVNGTTDSFNGLYKAILLANEIRRRYEEHRLNSAIHENDDTVNRVATPPVKVAKLSITGLTWVISDPRYGQLADDPADVNVFNGTTPIAVDMVSGELGAIVLTNTPAPLSTLTCDYYNLINPPLSITRLNDFGFNLNQENNRGYGGYPGQQRRQRAFLLNSKNPGFGIKSPVQPKQIGWKYKAIRSEGSALLNDPTSLLLNAPTNKITYPIKTEVVQEATVNYDSYVLPTSYPDPWTFNGTGLTQLNAQLSSLDIQDNSATFYLNPGPPFYSHPIDLQFTSSVYSAFRCWAEYGESYILSGNFAGVGFAITNGERAALAGLLAAPATNLSTAIALVNQIKLKLAAHFVATGVHIPNDTIDRIERNDAYDLITAANLLQFLATKYEAHRVRGSYQIHVVADTTNMASTALVNTEAALVSAVNTFAEVLNAHYIESGVHFTDDEENTIDPVFQVGLFKSGGFLEDVNSWETFAHDWTSETTYRLHIDDAGKASVRLSGDINPRIELLASEQCKASEVNLKLNPINQAVFGAFGNGSSSLSHWKLVRVQTVPQVSTQVGQNKNVEYLASTNKTPSEATPPWIDVGQGGAEYIYNNSLIVDSTSYVSESDAEAAGILTGQFRGYVRPEFTLTDRNIFTTKFNLACDRYSFGLDNESASVRIADGQFITNFSLLNYDPTAATITGTNQTPSITINAGDTLELSVDGDDAVVITFPTPINSSPPTTDPVQDIANIINAAITGIASKVTLGPGDALKLTSPTKGASSSIRVIGGTAAATLGLPQQTVYGIDSRPLTKIGWSGVNLPNVAPDQWLASGSQPATMLDRDVEIIDDSLDDFLKYSVEGTAEAAEIFKDDSGWSVEFRVNVTSFDPANPVENKAFAGCLFGVDEGLDTIGGKNLEVHFVLGNGNVPALAVYSYDRTADLLEFVNVYNYNWKGAPHTYTLTKNGSSIYLQVDGNTFTTPITYSALQPGTIAGVKWGSGDTVTGNVDRTAARSTTVWSSVSAIAAPSSGATKYVGIYRGGDPAKLSSYYVSQHNWSNATDYMLVRDPVAGVSLKIGTDPIPVISTTYDALTVPLVTSDILAGLIPSGKYVAFGSFNASEIVRTKWSSVQYTVGKLTSQSEFVKYGQVLNRANVVSSSEHLKTQELHDHFATKIYSGGSPTDDFVADPNIPAALVLGEDTPTFEATQSLEALGGLLPQVTVISDPIDLMTSHGNVAGYENDLVNVVDEALVTSYDDVLARTIEFTTAFLAHVGSKSFHKSVNRTMVSELEQILEELNNGI